MLRLAVRSLLQHKLRAGLSVLGVICGVTAVLAMLSIGEGAKREVLDQIEQLGTKNVYVKAISLTEDQVIHARERCSKGLSFDDVERIRIGCEGAGEVAYIKELTASVIGTAKEGSPQILASSANYASVQKLLLHRGRFLSDLDIKRRHLVCVLGSKVAENFGESGRLDGTLRIEDQLYKIIGILKRNDGKTTKIPAVSRRDYNNTIFLPLGADNSQVVMRAEGAKGHQLSEVIVQMQSADQVAAGAKLIRRILANSHGGVEDYQIVVPQALLRQSQKTQRVFNIVLGAIAGISLVVGGIGIMNIMLATVSERKREIGIRRAVGATKKDILVQFLAETIVLTFSGGVIGVGAGVGAVWLITTFAEWNTAITSYAVLISLMTAISVGIFFGIYPAYRAAEMDPISALQDQ